MTVAEQTAFALPKQVQAQVAAAEARTKFKPLHAAPETPLVVEPAAPDPEPPAPPALPSNDAEYYKARFLTVDGLLKKRSQDFKERLNAKDVTIRALQAQVASTERTQRLDQLDPAKYLPANIIDEMGGTDVARHSLQGAARAMSDLNATPAAVPELPADPDPVDDRPEYLQVLSHMVPNWETTNKDARWLEWLIPARQTELNGYVASEDAQSIALMFQAFAESLIAKPPTPPVAPSSKRAGHNENPAPPQQRVSGDLKPLTNAYIQEMYAKGGRGQISEAEFAAFKQRLITERGTKNP